VSTAITPLAEESVWPHEQQRHQEHEEDRVHIVAAEVTVGEGLGDPEPEAADHGADVAAESAHRHREERLEDDDRADAVDRVGLGADERAEAGHQRAGDPEGHRRQEADVDAAQRGGDRVLGSGEAGEADHRVPRPHVRADRQQEGEADQHELGDRDAATEDAHVVVGHDALDASGLAVPDQQDHALHDHRPSDRCDELAVDGRPRDRAYGDPLLEHADDEADGSADHDREQRCQAERRAHPVGEEDPHHEVLGLGEVEAARCHEHDVEAHGDDHVDRAEREPGPEGEHHRCSPPGTGSPSTVMRLRQSAGR
jgi:hypothetical protein